MSVWAFSVGEEVNPQRIMPNLLDTDEWRCGGTTISRGLRSASPSSPEPYKHNTSPCL
jgi:hypothetical protein